MSTRWPAVGSGPDGMRRGWGTHDRNTEWGRRHSERLGWGCGAGGRGWVPGALPVSFSCSEHRLCLILSPPLGRNEKNFLNPVHLFSAEEKIKKP